MQITFYQKPDGRQKSLEIKNVLPEDEKWFSANNIKISMEDIGGDFAVYGDTGMVDEDGETIEMLVIAQGRTCEETLSALRRECESVMGGGE